MTNDEFRLFAHKVVDWIADYYQSIETYPVKSVVPPGAVIDMLPLSPPQTNESFDKIFKEFLSIIMPGITHWQHPKFFAYFPANTSYPSILAEFLTAAIAVQGMSWQTSPAATELEQRIIEWLIQMLGFPPSFSGVIQDSASISTLIALISARENYSNYQINKKGFYNEKSPFIIYCSSQAHSSVTKGVKIAGFGEENLRIIDTNNDFSINFIQLEKQIENDINLGFRPLIVIAALGTTSSNAFDSILDISSICQKYNLWLHIDAAYAGTALLLPEYQHLIKGIEYTDSFVFNPHKWMFTNFDCSIYLVKNKDILTKTFQILPEYLKTKEGGLVTNYRDWGIGLGRRFRSLKLWFVIRSYGVDGLKNIIRNHIKLANILAGKIDASENFELMVPVSLNLICFRYKPKGISELEILNKINTTLMENINNSGKMYLTHTKLNSQLVLRLAIGQTYVNEKHIFEAWDDIQNFARLLTNNDHNEKILK